MPPMGDNFWLLHADDSNSGGSVSQSASSWASSCEAHKPIRDMGFSMLSSSRILHIVGTYTFVYAVANVRTHKHGHSYMVPIM
jgi:hypothetical protein